MHTHTLGQFRTSTTGIIVLGQSAGIGTIKCGVDIQIWVKCRHYFGYCTWNGNVRDHETIIKQNLYCCLMFCAFCLFVWDSCLVERGWIIIMLQRFNTLVFPLSLVTINLPEGWALFEDSLCWCFSNNFRNGVNLMLASLIQPMKPKTMWSFSTL